MMFSRWLQRGIRRLTRPAVLRRMDVTGRGASRRSGGQETGKPRVYIAELDSALGGGENNAALLYEDFFRRFSGVWNSLGVGPGSVKARETSRVLVKINLNTADPYPASTDPLMLQALLIFLRESGFANIRVGDCSSVSAVPTRRVAEKTGVLEIVSHFGEFVCFDEQPWQRMETGLSLLPTLTVPQAVYDADLLIHLANMKTHSLADFSFGMKLGVGYMHPLERYALHKDNLQEKIAMLASLISPDLTLVDGRQAFVCGGPVKGKLAPANLVVGGRHSLAVDVEAYLRLYQLKQRCGCVENFSEDPFSMRQLSYARELGVGGGPWQGYDTVEI